MLSWSASISNNENNLSWRRPNNGGKQQFNRSGRNSPRSQRKQWSPQNQLNLNPRDIQTGEVMKCHGCGSRFHLYRSIQCPKNVKSLNVAEDEEDNLNVEHIFASEQDFVSKIDLDFGYGVIDSAATKTVCGQMWFENFKKYLSSIHKQELSLSFEDFEPSSLTLKSQLFAFSFQAITF